VVVEDVGQSSEPAKRDVARETEVRTDKLRAYDVLSRLLRDRRKKKFDVDELLEIRRRVAIGCGPHLLGGKHDRISHR